MTSPDGLAPFFIVPTFPSLHTPSLNLGPGPRAPVMRLTLENVAMSSFYHLTQIKAFRAFVASFDLRSAAHPSFAPRIPTPSHGQHIGFFLIVTFGLTSESQGSALPCSVALEKALVDLVLNLFATTFILFLDLQRIAGVGRPLLLHTLEDCKVSRSYCRCFQRIDFVENP